MNWKDEVLAITRLRAENKELRAEVERLRAALNEIASWREGPVVNGGFDEPGSARTARVALAKEEA